MLKIISLNARIWKLNPVTEPCRWQRTECLSAFVAVACSGWGWGDPGPGLTVPPCPASSPPAPDTGLGPCSVRQGSGTGTIKRTPDAGWSSGGTPVSWSSGGGIRWRRVPIGRSFMSCLCSRTPPAVSTWAMYGSTQSVTPSDTSRG